VKLKVAGVGGVPSTGATAVVMNVTAVKSTTVSHLTVFPDGQALPNVSNLNYAAGQIVANLVIVPLVDGTVDLRNSQGSIDLVADVTGYFASTGSAFHPADPVRLLDTRAGIGVPLGAVGPGQTILLADILGANGVPMSGVTAVVLNVTVTQPTALSFLTVYPDGQPLPNVSDVNFIKAQTIANLVVVPVLDGKIDFYNSAGSVAVIADLNGYFTS
jgi:hypothetical protein